MEVANVPFLQKVNHVQVVNSTTTNVGIVDRELIHERESGRQCRNGLSGRNAREPCDCCGGDEAANHGCLAGG